MYRYLKSWGNSVKTTKMDTLTLKCPSNNWNQRLLVIKTSWWKIMKELAQWKIQLCSTNRILAAPWYRRVDLQNRLKRTDGRISKPCFWKSCFSSYSNNQTWRLTLKMSIVHRCLSLRIQQRLLEWDSWMQGKRQNAIAGMQPGTQFLQDKSICFQSGLFSPSKS